MHNERGIQRGKDFEELIKQQFLEIPNTTVNRLPDPTQGYLGVRNISDFIMYHYPYQYYIECKTVHSHRMPMANVTYNQRTGMLEASRVKGVVAGILCWFIPEDVTMFIPIQVFERHRLAGDKSINLNQAIDKDFIFLDGTKKRVFFDYDIEAFLKTCEKKKLGEKEYNV